VSKRFSENCARERREIFRRRQLSDDVTALGESITYAAADVKQLIESSTKLTVKWNSPQARGGNEKVL
jgi:hypothetical protein